MSKNFYSGGFLYHPGSQKILLQKDSLDPKSTWTLIEGSDGEDFSKVLSKALKLKLRSVKIYPVYDYVVKGKKRLISYAEVRELSEFPNRKNFTFAWFLFTQIAKLPITSQAKQDVIVGRRVIDSAVRKTAGEQTVG